MMPEENKSVGWLAGMLALLVAYFGWGFLAADYFQNDPAGPEKANFWVNSLTQIPNAPAVLAHGFRERMWVIGVIVGLEVVVLILWVVLKKLEKELAK